MHRWRALIVMGITLILLLGMSPLTQAQDRSSAPVQSNFLVRLRVALSRAAQSTISTIGHYFQTKGGKVRATGDTVTARPTADPIRVTAAPITMDVTDVQRVLLRPASAVPSLPSTPNVTLFSATMPAGSVASSATVPTASRAESPAAPPSIITIRSSLAPLTGQSQSASSPLRFGTPSGRQEASSGAGAVPTPSRGVSPRMPTPTLSVATPAAVPTASRDILNYKKLEGPSGAAASGTPSPFSTSPMSSSASSVGATSSVSTGSSSAPSSASSAAPPPMARDTATAPLPAPTAPSPSPAAVAGTPAPVVSTPPPAAPASPAPLTAALPSPEARPTSTAPRTEASTVRPSATETRPEINCRDIHDVIANRMPCRCPLRDSGLGNILPTSDASREPRAVSIESGKVLIAPTPFLRDALNCGVDTSTSDSASTFTLSQPRLRGSERDLVVVDVFVTQDGRMFGIAVDDSESRTIRGIAIWDPGSTASNSTMTFKSFPEFLQLTERVRGMNAVKDTATGKTSLDITFIDRTGAQVPHHCDLNRDESLTCSETPPASAPTAEFPTRQ